MGIRVNTCKYILGSSLFAGTDVWEALMAGNDLDIHLGNNRTMVSKEMLGYELDALHVGGEDNPQPSLCEVSQADYDLVQKRLDEIDDETYIDCDN